MGKIVAIANQKGGVGKTTTAINLSAAVAKKGYKVMLVDLDPQGNATSGLGVAKQKGMLTSYDVLINEVNVTEAVQKTMIDTLFILPSGIQLAGAEVELVSMEEREHRLKKILSEIKEEYDFILIDCPPSWKD